jgi:hypothetical protein
MLLRSPKIPVIGARRAVQPREYGVDDAFMLLLRHGSGIHAV